MGVYKARSFSSLMVEYFPNMHKALGFIPSTAEKKKNKTEKPSRSFISNNENLESDL
jgi:hypothetical protein